MTAKQRNTLSVTMTVERALLVRAREAGKKWQEENREAIDALNRFHDEYGCFSDEYRTF